MDRLKTMKEHLTSLVDAQISGNIENVNSKELGEAVDMIKDLAEAVYYCTITEAMEGQKEEEKIMEKMSNRYYTHPYYEEMYPERMYYGGRGANGRGGNNTNSYDGQSQSTNYYPSHGSTPVSAYYSERPMMMEHDPREGRSYMQRRHYMESKEMHQDSAKSMQELDKYIQELSSDITDMIKQATPEEKQMLQQKISMLATKIK